MEEFNFSKNLNTMLKMPELDSVTLAYCINGFMYACNVDTDNSTYTNVITRDEYKSATLTWNDNEEDHVRLQPENDSYAPIILTSVRILGKAIGLYRKI